MSNNQNFRFPDGIDEPKLILFWEVPVFITAVALGGIGIVMKSGSMFLGGIVAAYYLLRFFRRQFDSAKRNELLHTLYHYHAASDKVLKQFPSTYKEFSGK